MFTWITNVITFFMVSSLLTIKLPFTVPEVNWGRAFLTWIVVDTIITIITKVVKAVKEEIKKRK